MLMWRRVDIDTFSADDSDVQDEKLVRLLSRFSTAGFKKVEHEERMSFPRGLSSCQHICTNIPNLWKVFTAAYRASSKVVFRVWIGSLAKPPAPIERYSEECLLLLQAMAVPQKRSCFPHPEH